MAVKFITTLNGVITGKHHGDIDADFFGTPYYGHKRTEIPQNAEVSQLELESYYDKNWKRKTDIQLIDEGLLLMPKGYIREGNELRAMTQEERVIAGLDKPQPGFKVEGGKIVPMTLKEQVTEKQITQEEYEKRITAENEGELNRRLAELQTPEALAQAEIDEKYAAERKAKLTALLAVKKQAGWPLEINWPKE